MGKISDFVRAEETAFLSVHNAILIMKHFCNDSGRTIGKFFGQTQIFKNLPLYKKNEFLSFDIEEDKELTKEIIECLISGETDRTGMFPDGVQKVFWKRSDFLFFVPILELGITQEVIEHFFGYRFSLDDPNGYKPFLNFKKAPKISKAPLPITPLKGGCSLVTPQNTDQTMIEKLNDKIFDLERTLNDLKDEVLKKDIKISELESNSSGVAKPTVGYAPPEHYQKQSDELLIEVERLKAENLEKDQKIKEIELLLNADKEPQLGTREQNNILKVLAVLADMEKKIDISKPYEAHGIMKPKAELLGIDKFPSDESIKKWFEKAREYKNPN